jgi:hypothetical protein
MNSLCLQVALNQKGIQKSGAQFGAPNRPERQFKFSYEQAATAIKESCQNNNLHINTLCRQPQNSLAHIFFIFPYYWDNLYLGQRNIQTPLSYHLLM